jgi:hypothetical protein
LHPKEAPVKTSALPYKTICVVAVLLATLAFTSGSKPIDASVSSPLVPTIVANIALTGQTATIPTTTLFTPNVSGPYRLTQYMVQTTPSEGENQYSWNLGFSWTDDAGVEGVGEVGDLYSGLAIWDFQVPPSAWSSTVSVIEAIAGHPVTYEVNTNAPGGTCNTCGAYSLYITAEKI